MSDQILHAYERMEFQAARAFHVFLYVAHFNEANHLQIGFGVESASGLQRTHIAGPQVHELHVKLMADWLRRHGTPLLVEDNPGPRGHPFSSTMNIDLEKRMAVEKFLPLYAGKYMPLVVWPELTRGQSERFGDMIQRVANRSWHHPLDWDVRHASLKDGRFVWMAYDSDLKKIRLGLGFHGENNEAQYGKHCYAIAKREINAFAAHHFHLVDAALQFFDLPPRWPSTLSPFVLGATKQAFIVELVKLAEEVWPGELGR